MFQVLVRPAGSDRFDPTGDVYAARYLAEARCREFRAQGHAADIAEEDTPPAPPPAPAAPDPELVALRAQIAAMQAERAHWRQEIAQVRAAVALVATTPVPAMPAAGTTAGEAVAGAAPADPTGSGAH